MSTSSKGARAGGSGKGGQSAQVQAPPREIANFGASLKSAAQRCQEGADPQADGGKQALPGHENLVNQLQVALEKGNVQTRSALGQRFIAHLGENPESKAGYDAIKGTGSTAFKQEFRIKLANMLFESSTVVIKSKVELLREEYGEEGRYMSFERLIVQEGGMDSEKAVKAAMSYAAECVARGYPWVFWHDMKKVTELLVFERVRNHRFEKTWPIAQCQKMVRDVEGKLTDPNEVKQENTVPAHVLHTIQT